MCELIAFLTIYERGVLSLEMSDNSERYSVPGVEGKDEPIQSYLRLWLLWRLCLQLVLGRCLRLENIINQISDSAKGKPPVWTSRQRNSKTGQQACFHSTHTPVSSWQLQYSYIHMKHTCTATKTTGIERKKGRQRDKDRLVSTHRQPHVYCTQNWSLSQSGKLKSYWPALCSEIRMQFLSQMFYIFGKIKSLNVSKLFINQ